MPRQILIADGPAQPNPEEIDTFWEHAQKLFTGLEDNYQVRSLGIDADTTTQILEYIKTRDKVATFSLPWVIEANTTTNSLHLATQIWSMGHGIATLEANQLLDLFDRSIQPEALLDQSVRTMLAGVVSTSAA